MKENTPLSDYDDEELKQLEITRSWNNVPKLETIIEEMRYREQRRIADSLRKIVTVQVVFAALAVVVAIVVAATSIAKFVGN